MHEWYVEFKPKIPLLLIREKGQEGMYLGSFMETNDKLIKNAREVIKNEWNGAVVNIYKKVM
jgi:hypothetical protein